MYRLTSVAAAFDVSMTDCTLELVLGILLVFSDNSLNLS